MILRLLTALLCSSLVPWPYVRAQEAQPEAGELFEKRVRPVLIERCYRCHSAQAEKLKGGLMLDSKAGLLKGGEGGPVVVPGHPEASRLLVALAYTDPDLQMPPKGKLPEQEIADLTAWVKMGTPWPQERGPHLTEQHDAFDLAARRQRHWAWKPISAPGLPVIKNEAWINDPVDRFILAQLEKAQLRPAPPAGPESLLRRLCFDLVGLPPTPAQSGAWASNPSQAAYDETVDRLLASPQFGERWARHWLDLVRYSETLGHEFDYPTPNAWRYRDYVIRAFNTDVPYNKFALEHVAGDLLDPPRRDPVSGFNESIIGTAFYWLGQREHSPVDVRQHQAEVIDNQIDVLSKTFLGLTVACARCHDHKFDAIPARDYYSLYSILSSSRYTQARIDPPEPLLGQLARLKALKSEIRRAVARVWSDQASRTAAFLLASESLRVGSGFNADAQDVELAAAEFNVVPEQLERWIAALDEPPAPPGEHPLVEWVKWGKPAPTADRRSSAQAAHGAKPKQVPFASFEAGPGFADWIPEGEAFHDGPAKAGEMIVGGPRRPVAALLEAPAVHSGIVSRRLQGALRSPTFTITNRYIHILAAGRGTRILVPIDNFTMIRDPIYGGLKQVLHDDHFRWLTIDLEMWKGHRAYLEFSDSSTPDLTDLGNTEGCDPNGYMAVREVVFSDESQPRPVDAKPPASASPALPSSRDELAATYQEQITRAVQDWSAENGRPLRLDQAALLNWLIQRELLDAAQSDLVVRLASAYNALEAALPDPVRVPAIVEGTGLDEHVFVRGNYRLVGELAPRGFLQAIAGCEQLPVPQGSGRRELAERMLSPSNPFLARVLVNRVWLHLFGRGLVPTPDDFGALGQAPTHPELLDWLADWFRTEGQWSMKRLIRLLVTSSTYRMSSRPSDLTTEEHDPDNRLWHRMPVRRLEGEAIRDAILAVSGRLDPAMFGPPVPIHLTEFMEGRGRPGSSGPLDGAGRRSVYIEVRRNFVSPMMRTFDMPVPFTTVGRRTVSNVPAQSLILMNDPFVVGEARRWSERVLARTGNQPTARVEDLYREAFNRSPSARELSEALAFTRQQAEAYGLAGADSADDSRVWADLAHVLFNVKEFVFVN